jgi:hypothetical protein
MPKVIDNQTTLQKIQTKIQSLNEEIANKQAEIRELETAAAIIRQLEDPVLPFADKTIVDCATILLTEKSPRYFREVAREAIARGYKSQKGGDLEIVSKSFQTALINFKDLFQRVGPGQFQLKKKDEEKPGTSAQPGK